VAEKVLFVMFKLDGGELMKLGERSVFHMPTASGNWEEEGLANFGVTFSRHIVPHILLYNITARQKFICLPV